MNETALVEGPRSWGTVWEGEGSDLQKSFAAHARPGRLALPSNCGESQGQNGDSLASFQHYRREDAMRPLNLNSFIPSLVAGAVLVTLHHGASFGSSDVGGAITRSETLQRAQYWVDQKFTYSQSASAPDISGRHYRTDCSGLVSNAWHLSTSLLTNNFLSNAQAHVAGMRVIALDSLQPGDAIVRDSDGPGPDGHIELFAFWKNNADHQQGAYVYSFNSNGETVQNPYANSNFGNRGFDSWSNLNTFTAIRYDNVIADPAPAPVIDPQASHLVDFDGDGKVDFLGLGISGNDLWFVPNTSTPGSPLRGQSIHMTDGWQTVTRFWLVDYDGDGRADIVGLNGTDQLLVWRNISTPGHPSVAPFVSLGSGWSTVTKLVFMDFTGDGKVDIGGWDVWTANQLWVIPNTSTPGNPSRGQSIHVSDGWQSVISYWVADYDGDGKTDLLGLNGPDQLLVWRNIGANGTPALAPCVSLGSGWSTVTKLRIADLTGDGKPDVFGWDVWTANQLWVIPNTSTPGNPSRGQSIHVSDGWQTVITYLVGDYDGDGRQDLLGLNGPDQLLVWRNTSANNTPALAPFASLGSGWSTFGKMPTAQQ